MKYRKMISWLITMTMMIAMVPITVQAAAVLPDEPIVFTKEYVDGTGGTPDMLKLSAYVTGYSSSSTQTTPTDVILVLDQSGSMDEAVTGSTTTKLEAMRGAVSQFVSSVAELNTNNDDTFRVAIVGFASQSGYSDNTEILTIQSSETVTETVYLPVTGNLDTDNIYYIAQGTGYAGIRYFNRSSSWGTTYPAGWYTYRQTLAGYSRQNAVDTSSVTVYERTSQRVQEYSAGVAYDDLTANDYLTAFVNCTTEAVSEEGLIYDAVEALDGNGATRTDLGMEMAADIFKAQEADDPDFYANRNKVVVVLSDGVPTTNTDFNETVANDAVEAALAMKSGGAYINAIYFGTPTNNARSFMQALSSNYPNATEWNNLGTQVAEDYYKAHSESSDIEADFSEIVYSISARSQIDENSVVTDTISPWFRLRHDSVGEDGSINTDVIRVVTEDRTADGWSGREIPLRTANVTIGDDEKTVAVSGFDFAYHCVTDVAKDGNSDYGRRLIIYIPILPDENADTFGGYLPTNDDAKILRTAAATTPEITAEGCMGDVPMNTAIGFAQYSYHIDTDYTKTVAYEEILPQAFDTMLTHIPDGTNNLGVNLTYKLIDTMDTQSNLVEGEINRDDDVVLGTLTVPAGQAVDITDFSLWDFGDNSEILLEIEDDGSNWTENIYALQCTMESLNNEVPNVTTYGVLEVAATRENEQHIVYGVIDEGGTLSVPNDAPGSLVHLTYTELVAEGEDSAVMTFDVKEGYEIAKIDKYTRAGEGADLVTTSIYDGTQTGVLGDDGGYTFVAEDVEGYVAIVVTTTPIQYTLTTKTDDGAWIKAGETYNYDAINNLNVTYDAKDGYKITSIKYGETATGPLTELIGADLETLENLGITLQGDPQIGAVVVPRTHDNYVEITTEKLKYNVTYKYYQSIIDDTDGHIIRFDIIDEATEVYEDIEYDTLITQPLYNAGHEITIDEALYTHAGWFYYFENDIQFRALMDTTTIKMPAQDIVLYAPYLRNADIAVVNDEEEVFTVSKYVNGTLDQEMTFDFEAIFHEQVVGTAQITVSAGTYTDEAPAGTAEIHILLSALQHQQFENGEGRIYIREVDPEDGVMIYDSSIFAISVEEGSTVMRNLSVVDTPIVTGVTAVNAVVTPAPTETPTSPPGGGGGSSKGTIVITKTDSEDNTILLADAEFELYCEVNGEKTLIGTYTTNKDGKVTITGINPGEYYCVEVKAPEGYKLDDTKYYVTMKAGNRKTLDIANVKDDGTDDKDEENVPSQFTDDHYAYIIGYPDDTVRPEGSITRAEVATIFFRLLTDDIRNQNMTDENEFNDVKKGDWYNRAISTLAKMGIVDGYNDGSFMPNKPITRAEFAAMAARFDDDIREGTSTFTDIIGHWAEHEIKIAANNSWVEGYEDGSFRPTVNITRAEAMTLVNRVMQRNPESAEDMLDTMVKWPDNANTNAWYYLAVQEATNSHYYERKANGHEKWTDLREVRDWEEFER